MSKRSNLNPVEILTIGMGCILLLIVSIRPISELYSKEIIKRFHQIYYHNADLWANHTTWLGVQLEQTPHDCWIMQELINELKPDYVVEAGTLKGGSALFYATVLSHVNPAGKVITVDIKDQIDPATYRNEIFKNYVEFIQGDSVSKAVIEAIQHQVHNRNVLVTLDSLHTKDHVLQELNLYSKFVPLGGYIVVQDTNINGHPVLPGFGPGPMEAVDSFLQANPNFQADRSREKFMISFYPKGFLKRIR